MAQHAGPSRRRLSQVALIGAAGAVAGPLVGARDAFANYEIPIGTITLGGLLRSYVAAPVNAQGRCSWRFESNRTDTFRMSDTSGAQIDVTSNTTPITVGPISIGTGSNSISYGRSTKDTFALAYRVSQTQTYFTPTKPAGVLNTVDDTVFSFVYKPEFRIYQVYDDEGYEIPGSYTYEFIGLGGLFTRTAYQLRADFGLRNDIGGETADGFLSQYPLMESDSAEALGLGGPRFTKLPNISTGSPEDFSE